MPSTAKTWINGQCCPLCVYTYCKLAIYWVAGTGGLYPVIRCFDILASSPNINDYISCVVHLQYLASNFELD